jgi:hypothetical protein
MLPAPDLALQRSTVEAVSRLFSQPGVCRGSLKPPSKGKDATDHAHSAPRHTLQFLAGVLLHMFEIGLYRASGLTLSWDAHSSLLYIGPGHC